ncbi:MAG: AAA family ATPase [Pseudomonadota bacterium]
MNEPLKVTLEDDGARGLVRLSRRGLKSLGLSPGDVVAVEGPRRSYGRVVPGLVAAGKVDLDAAIAQNVKAAAEDNVTLTAADLQAAETLVMRVSGPRPTDADAVRDAVFEMALTQGDRIPFGREGQLEVVAITPEAGGIVRDTTALSVQALSDSAPIYEGVGGLSEEIARVHDMIATPLLRPELYNRLGIAPPRGVLFSGPPGSGKTLLARAVARQTKAAFFHINGPEIVTKHYGESEAALRKVFAAAEKESPAIIFIDEIDAIAPARAQLSDDKQVERRVVAQLLTLMDGMSERGRIVLMAATNLPDALDPALRRPGRFDREVLFRPPSVEQRSDILSVHLNAAALDDDVDLDGLADKTHGYVGADLAALTREAAMAALARTVKAAGGEELVRAEDLKITSADLDHGFRMTAPSILRGTGSGGSPVGWDDIGGLDQAKSTLLDAVSGPLTHPDAYAAFGVEPPSGLLLCGPPGTGKTLIARALATETGMNFIPVRPPRLLSQYFGAAERALAELFNTARLSQPSLLFFDELDAIAPRRLGKDPVLDRIVAQFLMELDGVEENSGLVVLAATNRPNAIDPALTRPGRFDVVVDFPMPGRDARLAILEVHLAQRPLSADVDLPTLADQTDGLNGADLAAVAEDAARRALKRRLSDTDTPSMIENDDLTRGIAEIRRGQKTKSGNFLDPGGYP